MSEQRTKDPGVNSERIEQALEALDDAFDWEKTPQGFDYWRQVYRNLIALIPEDSSNE